LRIERSSVRDTAAFALTATVAAAAAVTPGLSAKCALLGVAALVFAFVVVCETATAWLYLFFAVDLLTPPLPSGSGFAGLHLAPAALGLGIFAGVLHRAEWRVRGGGVLLALAAFGLSLVASSPFALAYSGTDVAMGSAVRIALFSIAVYVFAYSLCGPEGGAGNSLRFANFLFAIAVIAAVFACLDFYFHFPAPAGFSDQFVWLEDGVFRRAQGLFYDASTLGNFCACFVIYALIRLAEGRTEPRALRFLMAAGALVLSTAIMLSYSRASVITVAIAMAAYAMLAGVRIRRTAAGIVVAGVIAAIAVQVAYPSFASNYWSHLGGTIRYLSERPDGVLSGRLTNWQRLGDFVSSHPWQTIFGIGYKTLPYTSYLGDPVIADNTYLSLLIETGIGGFCTFLVLLGLVLRVSFRAAKSAERQASLLGKWTFCFWCGQSVQMLSGDLLTYWRVLPVYFWAIGAAIRACEVGD
jgi:O-antigen ligase